MKPIDHSYQVLYSELAQRALDAAFTSDFSVDGRFVTQENNGRRHWYFDTTKDGSGKNRRYVGPIDDPDITAPVEAIHVRTLSSATLSTYSPEVASSGCAACGSALPPIQPIRPFQARALRTRPCRR